MAPATAPRTEPMPPTTTIVRIKMVVWKPRLSGWMKEMNRVYMPPAMPAKAAEMTKAACFMARALMPIAMAATSLSRTARSAEPNCERDSHTVTHSINAAMATTKG